MQWPRSAFLPPRPPAPNPQRPAGVQDLWGPNAESRRVAPQGVPTAARLPRQVFILGATPFADCTAATVVTLMGFDLATGLGHPYLIGFGPGAGRMINLVGDLSWSAADSEAVARATLIAAINTARQLHINDRENAPFRAYEIPNWNNSEFTAMAIEREWPSIGGGNAVPILGTGAGAGTMAPIQFLGPFTKVWEPGVRAQECLPARIGPQPAFVPFNAEPRGSDAVPPGGDNTIVIG